MLAEKTDLIVWGCPFAFDAVSTMPSFARDEADFGAEAAYRRVLESVYLGRKP